MARKQHRSASGAEKLALLAGDRARDMDRSAVLHGDLPAIRAEILAVTQGNVPAWLARLLPSGAGWSRLAGGLLIQWGAGVIASGSGATTGTLPIAFPNAAHGIIASPTGADARSIAIHLPNLSQWQASARLAAGGEATDATPFFFLAVGT